MNSYRYFLGFVAVGMIFFTAACGGFEEPLTAADCYEDEYFDPSDEACYLKESVYADEGDEDFVGDEAAYDDIVNDDAAYDDDFVLTAADCYEDEYFDEADQTCYLNEEAFAAEDGGNLGGWLSSLAEEIVDNEVAFSDGGEGQVIIQYAVVGDRISDPQNGEALTDLESEIQNDSASHNALWEQFATLIPQEFRRDLTQFGVFTDGIDGTLAYVEPNPDNPETWLIVLDPADTADRDDFTYTLIHEYGHVLTLNDRQVPFDQEAYFDDTGDAYEAAAEACSTFFTGEGCAEDTSYIGAFYATFWTEIYDELPFPDEEGIVDEDELADFYDRYADQFVTDYAATNPGEDIAESWTHFVLKPKPAGNTVAEEKILFFYQYPELVKLRQEILTRLYAQTRG
ncbi:MAG: hypothetical protein QNJ45_15525 [Ardenticatenaceae bacterium]|nr:hypothetical protein [Ardenticatenaceae bacterium]